MQACEIGMCFNDVMVQAILDGSKTQTRRPLRVQPPEWARVVSIMCHGGLFMWSEPEQEPPRPLRRWPVDKRGDFCALTAPGLPRFTRIWVREAYRVQEFSFAPDLWCKVQYRADGSERVITGAKGAMYVNAKNPRAWKPSIHMPRAFCRQELLITSNRPERVQDLSGFSAAREGCYKSTMENPILAFRDTWDAIYAARGLSWDVNPWVWVIEFCKVDQKAQV